MALTMLEIRNAKKGVHADGNGLYLSVGAGGARSWIFRYQIKKRRREMGIGSLVALPPVEARARAAALRTQVRQGIDPLEQREVLECRANAERAAADHEKRLNAATFKVIAKEHIAQHEDSWRNDKHRQQWTNTLKTYAYPVIGDIAVNSITSEQVLSVLKPIWSEKPETARRVRMRIETVLNAAKVRGLRSGENPAAWRGVLEGVLPRVRSRQLKHHPALDWRIAPAFFARLALQAGTGARALEFAILTAARSGEVRGATWAEIDVESKMWVVPADRMKTGRAHRVVLNDAAMDLLATLPRVVGTDLLFPGIRKQILSDMTLSAVLKRMKLVGVTVHGFRSTFRDWAAEETGFHPETIEMALSHSVGTKVELAYRRGDQLEKRRRLMDDWCSYLKGESFHPCPGA